MINFKILSDSGVVVVEPSGPLSEGDFEGLSTAVDEYLERHERLKGLVIHVEQFPGWENLGGFVQHIKFVRGHHEKIGKVALVSDSKIASLAPKLADHFISAEVKAFSFCDLDPALAWVTQV
tara:strand:- start:2322 stop:2687 length:366 start_codon:yes stop_codon:yes gene_type:complete